MTSITLLTTLLPEVDQRALAAARLDELLAQSEPLDQAQRAVLLCSIASTRAQLALQEGETDV